MVPLFLLLGSTVLFRLAGFFGVGRYRDFTGCLAAGLAVMFLFTGIAHFTALQEDYLRMIPFEFFRSVTTVYITGSFEMAGAIGLVFRKTRFIAGILLILFLVAVLPANIHASFTQISFNDNPPTDLWLRIAIQLIFITALILAIRRPAGSSADGTKEEPC